MATKIASRGRSYSLRRLRSLTFALSRQLSPASLIAWGVVVLLVPVWGFLRTGNKAFRDELDVFSFVMTSPVMLVFPLLVLCTSCFPLFSETQRRFAYQAAYRVGRTSYIFSRFAATAFSAFVGWFGIVIVTFVIAFFFWHGIGSQRLMPEVYGDFPSPDLRMTYAQWLTEGTWAFGLKYAALVGLAAACIAVLTACATFLISNPFFAGSIATVLYFLQTLFAALGGAPTLGMMYVVFPFGLVQQPLDQVAPTWFSLLALVALSVATVVASRNSIRALQ